MRSARKLIVASAMFAILAGTSSCKREYRGYRVAPPNAMAATTVRVSDLQPAGGEPDQPVKNGYEENAFAMSEGQRLFDAYNCSGCHAHGGGGMGPPLMDDKWIYGSQPQQIYATIVEGRPNGMPSWRGRIPNNQVWQLVAFVRSMSGLANKTWAPGREDHMAGPTPPNTVDPTQPIISSEPSGAPGTPPPGPTPEAPSPESLRQVKPVETQPTTLPSATQPNATQPATQP